MNAAPYEGLNEISNVYQMVLLATWREARRKSPNPEDIPFSKEDVVRHGDVLRHQGISTRALAVKNVPDIIYTFRARADLPAEILATGHYAIVGRGKGRYAFVKLPRPNRILLPTKMTKVVMDTAIPKWARPYMTNDEQGMLTSIAVNQLVAKYLNLKVAFRLQSHLRVGVRNYGQVEVDELYVGETHKGKHVGIAVEAKDSSALDCLNVSQLFGTAQALRAHFGGMEHHLIGAKPNGANHICMGAFNIPPSADQLKQTKKWVAYELR